MGKPTHWLLGAATLSCATLTACAGAGPSGSGHGIAPDHGSYAARRMTNATVLEGAQLWQRSGNLITAMRNGVSNVQIRQTPDGNCPRITLRGAKTFVGPSNPQVYIDGQRANDTCILEMINADDVERIEVYPMGVTSRPGYNSHAYGLILVFMRGME